MGNVEMTGVVSVMVSSKRIFGSGLAGLGYSHPWLLDSASLTG
uniref:Uncharacterized protein n=1 Tax=Candidatus Kentrum sp. LPFa TaxID=2126335 RepID=A0A450W4K0_9GAMM|nr:MAG: hypothetical protein BECKLPF1236B_GA0070989_10283 [Candidatus Kentron sp. LPFa]